MADILTLTGRIRNLSPTVWQVGSGPGRWSVAGYLTRVEQRKKRLRELRTSPLDCRVPQNGELEFALRIDTGGLPAGIYEVWVDMLMERQYWMAFHGAVPVAATLRIETFSHEIAVDADAVTLSPGGTAVLSGTVRNTCSKPWPEGAGAEPLKLGARLCRPSVTGRRCANSVLSWNGCRKPRRTRSTSAWCSIRKSCSAASTSSVSIS